MTDQTRYVTAPMSRFINDTANVTTNATVTGASDNNTSPVIGDMLGFVIHYSLFGLLALMAVANFAGNGLTLHVIRTTPRLWTKTNFILANLTIADIWGEVSTSYGLFLTQ